VARNRAHQLPAILCERGLDRIFGRLVSDAVIGRAQQDLIEIDAIAVALLVQIGISPNLRLLLVISG
jgi:hypothetical protein